MTRWKARGRLSISANWTFSPALTVEAIWADSGQNCGFWKGCGSLWAQISGKGVSTNDFWLSSGVVCVILRLAVLIQYRRVTHAHRQTDWQTDRQTHTRWRLIVPAHRLRRAGKKRTNSRVNNLMCEIAHAQKRNPYHIWMKFSRVVDVHEIIAGEKFADDRFRGSGGSNLALSHWLWSSFLQHYRASVWTVSSHCSTVVLKLL